MSKKKRQFEVQENESIDECLNRIKEQGYSPIRRTEKPIFQEVKKAGETVYEPIGRHIVFEAVLIE
ncbi:NETI motif-containing protein [Neobacillus jeddahensis]|uniref:NETI motif-containing protein n=1 Tax=Neobacillus jeddahensis TaxID=1461580 RepID=UPI00058BA768|nr:NETI motif-containing protein [Neobacillus jeddahensis]